MASSDGAALEDESGNDEDDQRGARGRCGLEQQAPALQGEVLPAVDLSEEHGAGSQRALQSVEPPPESAIRAASAQPPPVTVHPPGPPQPAHAATPHFLPSILEPELRHEVSQGRDDSETAPLTGEGQGTQALDPITP